MQQWLSQKKWEKSDNNNNSIQSKSKHVICFEDHKNSPTMATTMVRLSLRKLQLQIATYHKYLLFRSFSFSDCMYYLSPHLTLSRLSLSLSLSHTHSLTHTLTLSLSHFITHSHFFTHSLSLSLSKTSSLTLSL